MVRGGVRSADHLLICDTEGNVNRRDDRTMIASLTLRDGQCGLHHKPITLMPRLLAL